MQLVKILGYSHIIISVGAGTTAYFSALSLGLEGGARDAACLICAFTGLGYTVQRFIKTQFFPHSAPPDRIAFMNKYGRHLVVGWVAVLIAAVNIVEVEFSHSSNALLVALIILSMSYAVVPLREKPHLKLPLVASVFALATVIYPACLAGLEVSDMTPTIATVLLARLLYVAGITIPFDVRDLHIDSTKMKTIPQQIGEKRALHRAMIFVLVSAILWSGLVTMGGVDKVVGVSLCIHSCISVAFVSPLFVRRNRSEIYYSLVLDGLLSFPFVILPLCYQLFQQ